MKDEIKEILDLLKYCVEKDEYLEVINMKEWKPLLDYITNLQQIEQEHKKINGKLREENNKLEIALQNIQEDYDKRIEQINYLNEELEEEKRIEEEDLKTIQRLEEENERLKEQANENKVIVEYTIKPSFTTRKLNDYKSRCKKASEYIKEHIRIDDEYPDYMEMLIEERDELLNILQNGSEEK